MKPPAITRPRCTGRFRSRERGVTMILVALAMVAIIAMAALSIDVITLYLAREEAQRSADAAALAAARVISISGMTGDPGNPPSWAPICGPGGLATQAATAVATQSAVGGTLAVVNVTYSAGGITLPDCTAVGGPFGVNPLVNVQVIRSSLPTFFSRIWGNTGNSVSATATAEAFNPSASDINTNGGATGTVTPVQPSCVKPWMVPNQNPNQPFNCNTVSNPTPCNPFVTTTPGNGSIVNPGILPATSTGVIGSTFNLFADCNIGTTGCVRNLNTLQPQANASVAGFTPATPNLEYLPGEAPTSSVAVPACAASGSGGNPLYEPAVAGCDQSTSYQCGVQGSSTPNLIDLSENPGGRPPTGGDTASAVACLLTNDPTNLPMSGQDSLDTTSYPYKITPGSANPLGAGVSGSVITSSNSIMSLPIYDSTLPLTFTGNQANVTIVGFLQVFVNQANPPDGSLYVTVLNVAGCGNNAGNRAVPGTSPVPVRLVTSP